MREIDALRQFERCVSALAQELGVKPEKSTVELCERIKSEQLNRVDPADIQLSLGRNSVSPDIVNRLKKLQAILSGVQRRIQRDIKAVEGAFDKD